MNKLSRKICTCNLGEFHYCGFSPYSVQRKNVVVLILFLLSFNFFGIPTGLHSNSSKMSSNTIIVFMILYYPGMQGSTNGPDHLFFLEELLSLKHHTRRSLSGKAWPSPPYNDKTDRSKSVMRHHLNISHVTISEY